MQTTSSLTTALFRLPIFEAEWVLYLLIAVSLVSVAIMLERWFFFAKRKVDVEAVHTRLDALLQAGDVETARAFLGTFDSLQTNIARRGLDKHHLGAGAVEQALEGAESMERLRFARGLGFLATVGSNAPFVGLFGTVLGIIRAFQDLSQDMSSASSSVMAGISEALVATAVGLLVAIPAVVAFNALQARVGKMQGQARLLSTAILGQLSEKEA